jgi:hypothetical protein
MKRPEACVENGVCNTEPKGLQEAFEAEREAVYEDAKWPVVILSSAAFGPAAEKKKQIIDALEADHSTVNKESHA